MLSFRLKKEKCPKVKCWQDSKRPNHATNTPTLDPVFVSPGKPSAVRAELRSQGRDILHHLCPVLYFQALCYLQYISPLSSLVPLSAQASRDSSSHWMRACAEEGTLDWQWLRVQIRPAPLHVVNPVWRRIIPSAELKSMLTPPALSWSLSFVQFLLPFNLQYIFVIYQSSLCFLVFNLFSQFSHYFPLFITSFSPPASFSFSAPLSLPSTGRLSVHLEGGRQASERQLKREWPQSWLKKRCSQWDIKKTRQADPGHQSLSVRMWWCNKSTNTPAKLWKQFIAVFRNV